MNAAYAITANPPLAGCVSARVFFSMCALRRYDAGERKLGQHASTHIHERTGARDPNQRRQSATMVFVCTFLFKPVNANMHTGRTATTTTHKFQCIGFAVGSGKSRRAAKRLVFFLLLFLSFGVLFVFICFSGSIARREIVCEHSGEKNN